MTPIKRIGVTGAVFDCSQGIQRMKSLRLHGIGDLRLHEEPKPEPQMGEVLLRVTAVGICGSDIHWFAEGTTGSAMLSQPFVLGHEFAAVVASGPLAGTRVAVEP